MSLDNTNNVLAILKKADSQFDITPVKQTNTQGQFVHTNRQGQFLRVALVLTFLLVDGPVRFFLKLYG